ncbi:hypothetical protein SCLCIDRAFT_26307 [Scleroderma citrinum Foug A]|uniref:Uncharacterized protein n=1 Tax=Scleroderma citrinum Foug A TaxID=1036808 RepID=A0A0C3A7E8_9AGAM|nr:hypothetical protein SCLCIDRAFT_26307 [Scleroderma citrinum Foug A]
MSERIVNTCYNLRHTVHVRARSAPSSPEAAAKGNDTPIEANRLYSDVVKAKDLAPSCVSDVSPDSRNFSSEYPDGQRSSEAIIIAGKLAAIHSSVKGLPGSTLTSVYSTPVPTEGENNGDDRRKIYERQRMISVTGVKKPGTKSTLSQGEGPSSLKGKGPDPRNWGALSVCEDELNLRVQREALASWKAAQGEESDIEAQQEAIASWNKVHELTKRELSSRNSFVRVPSSRDSSPRAPSSRGGSTRTPSPEGRPAMVLPPKVEKAAKIKEHKSHREREDKRKHTWPRAPDPVRMIVNKAIAQDKSRHKQHKTPRAMEPVEQVNWKSYIGLAFKHLGRKDKQAHQLSSDSSSSSLSDKSLRLSKPARPAAALSRPTRLWRPKGQRWTQMNPRAAAVADNGDTTVSKSRRRMKLKPIPPMEYDGSVNSKAFHHFITEGTAYVKDGEVPSKKQAFILLHYLTGKAHEFYVREVSGDPYRWRLSMFFRKLFNYCFPGNKTVQDYLYELNEIWNMIGEMDERTKVHKLWFGLRKEIQHDLWQDRLNLEISSLWSVIASAEIIEIAQSVTGGGPKLKNKRRENLPVVGSTTTTPDSEYQHHE